MIRFTHPQFLNARHPFASIANGSVTNSFLSAHRSPPIHAWISSSFFQAPIRSACFTSFVRKDRTICLLIDCYFLLKHIEKNGEALLTHQIQRLQLTSIIKLRTFCHFLFLIDHRSPAVAKLSHQLANFINI